MLSILMLAGTKDQEIKPTHNKSQHPQESPGNCTSTHLPALDLTDLHQHRQNSTGAVFVEFLLQDIGALCVGTECKCIVLPEECRARRGWIQPAEPPRHEFLLQG